ncbi:MAG: hypothetical protein IPP94_12570 [Ignavibacteria bacterium]|nr:hypothetical protein [Ignavibacteria bacterium]
MDPIQLLFDRMDAWRHLPNYQFERRADLFFSLYIPEALQAKTGIPFRDIIVPEFPLHISALHPDKNTNKSYKADYLAVSSDLKVAVLVELKTEIISKQPDLAIYLEAARQKGVAGLLENLRAVFKTTNAKPRYLRLLEIIEQTGLLHLPPMLRSYVERGDMEQAKLLMTKVNILANPETRVISIEPDRSDMDCISCAEFSDVVGRYGDPVSRRFALSLREWARIPAGNG